MRTMGPPFGSSVAYADRKDVEVEVDGEWYDGELRSWDQADDGS